MSILKKNPNTKRVIDLDGPDGNAYVLLGIAKGYCEQLPELNWDAIRYEMTMSDYENLIKVFDEYFGRFCNLVRTEKE